MEPKNPTNQPPMPQVKLVAFDMEFVQALANYLGTKPYSEVAQFIGRIQQTVIAAQGELPPVPPDKNPQ